MCLSNLNFVTGICRDTGHDTLKSDELQLPLGTRSSEYGLNVSLTLPDTCDGVVVSDTLAVFLISLSVLTKKWSQRLQTKLSKGRRV